MKKLFLDIVMKISKPGLGMILIFFSSTAFAAGVNYNNTTFKPLVTSSDVVGQFGTCTGVQYLGADGACHDTSEAGLWDVATGGINYAGGNVGIGTTAPGSKLVVEVAAKKRVGIEEVTTSSISDFSIGGAAIQFSRPTDGSDRMGGIFEYYSGSSYNLALAARSDIVFAVAGGGDYTQSEDVMRIASSGNVGIGTTDPSQQLEITGSLELPDTTSATTGVIYKGTVPFIHNFKHPTGGTAIPNGGNTFIGKNAGNFTMGSTASFNFEASDNTAIGENSFSHNTTGRRNTALGYASLQNNTTGKSNVAIGKGSSSSNTTGSSNLAVGESALANNTTGSSNLAVGERSMFYNKAGIHNIVFGYFAGYGVSGNSYSNSVLIGSKSGMALSTGGNNILIGYESGDSLTTGAGNIIIGYQEDAPTATTSDHLNIGGVIHGDLSTGNVGIGTATPGYALDVVGDSLSIPFRVQYSSTSEGLPTNLPVSITSLFVRNNTSAYGNSVAYLGGSNATTGINFGDKDSYSMGRIIYDNSDNSLRFSGNNMERISILSDGNVGIGITTPESKLDVNGDIHLTDMTAPATTANKLYSVGGALTWNGQAVATGTISSNSISQLDSSVTVTDTGTDGAITFATDNTTAMTIDEDGQVGIGTTTPGYPLHVYNDDTSTVLIESGSAFRVAGFQLKNPNNVWNFGVNNVGDVRLRDETNNQNVFQFEKGAPQDSFYMASSGNIGFGTTSPDSELHISGVSNPQFQITDTTVGSGATDGFIFQQGNTNTYLINQDSGNFYFQTDGATAMTIDSGNVGIGETTPLKKLHVNGGARFDNTSEADAVELGDGKIYWDSVNSELVIRVN